MDTEKKLKKESESIPFPLAKRIFAKTISKEFIAVKPLSEPTGLIWTSYIPLTTTKPMTDLESAIEDMRNEIFGSSEEFKPKKVLESRYAKVASAHKGYTTVTHRFTDDEDDEK